MKLTASLHLKNGGWKTILSFWESPLVSGAMLVSGRVVGSDVWKNAIVEVFRAIRVGRKKLEWPQPEPDELKWCSNLSQEKNPPSFPHVIWNFVGVFGGEMLRPFYRGLLVLLTVVNSPQLQVSMTWDTPSQ